LNSGPPVPQTGALTGLRYAPNGADYSGSREAAQPIACPLLRAHNDEGAPAGLKSVQNADAMAVLAMPGQAWSTGRPMDGPAPFMATRSRLRSLWSTGSITRLSSCWRVRLTALLTGPLFLLTTRGIFRDSEALASSMTVLSPYSADGASTVEPADMRRPSATRTVGVWLACVAALVFAMVLVGGATRLTESGLSIVEWKPVTGVIPPLSEPDWQAEFAKYKTIPQYEQLNHGMSLDEFKTIYWWEWTHRFLARVILVAFLLPFLWFLWRRAFDRRTALGLAGIFALGAVQGAVGWWMVASGLTERIRVSQYRLAFHLTLACMIYVALVWTADRLLFAPPAGAGEGRAGQGTETALPGRLRWSAGALLALAILQVYLGALVAGLHAGLVYNTWPLINGSIIPSAADLLFNQPLWRNVFENDLTVQFDHRMTAYALCALALFHAADARRLGPGPLAISAGFVAVAVLAQAGLGIMTLLFNVPLHLALTHQAMALVALTAATLHASRMLAGSAAGTAGVSPALS
jgi:heme a synthase